MTLIFDITKSNYLAFNLFLGRRSIVPKIFALLLFLFFTVDMARIGMNREEPQSVFIVLFVAVLFGLAATSFALGLGFLVIVLYIFLMPRNAKNKALFGRHEIEITDDGLLHRTSVSETRVQFEAIEKIASTKKYLFIMLGSVQGAIIPKRSIAEGNIADFERLLRERVGTHG